MKNKKIIIAIVLIVILGSLGYYYKGNINEEQADKSPNTVKEVTAQENIMGPVIEFDRTSHDFGLRGETEVVSTDFTVFNNGNQTLEIGRITTSCGCTSAKISTKEIEPNQSAKLTVVFDPNVHGEPVEKFKRMVFLETNDSNNKKAVVEIWIDIDEKNNK